MNLVGDGGREALLTEFETRVSGFAAEFCVNEIDAQDLIASLEADTAPLILDVRGVDEYAVSCIPGSVHVGKGAAQTMGEALGAFAQRFDARGAVMVCAGGYTSARSIAALPSKLRGSFRNLHGGAISYANAGGQFLDPYSGETVRVVHGYDKDWARYVLGPTSAVLPTSKS